jgi:hypothetical protein
MGFCSMWAVYLVWQVATIVLASVLLQVYTFFFQDRAEGRFWLSRRLQVYTYGLQVFWYSGVDTFEQSTS